MNTVYAAAATIKELRQTFETFTHKRGVPNIKLVGTTALNEIAHIVSEVFKRHGKRFVITSTTDGKHLKHSAHWIGEAFDCRIRHIPHGDRELLYTEIQHELACIQSKYQVIWESDHFHLGLTRFETERAYRGLSLLSNETNDNET